MSVERRLAIATIGFRGGIGGGGPGGIIYAGGLAVAVEDELAASLSGELAVSFILETQVPLEITALSVAVEQEYSVGLESC
jgi:hypothetical protein